MNSNFPREVLSTFLNAIASDVTPEDRKAARRVFMKVGWRVLIFVLLFWAYGLFEFLGWGGGFARASDVSTKIAEANRPLQKLLDEQQAALRHMSDMVMRSLSENKAAEIRALRYKQCKAASEDKEQFNNEIGRKQEEYRVIRGADVAYDVRCDQVM